MKKIEVLLDQRLLETVTAVATERGAVDHWPGPVGPDGRQSLFLLVPPHAEQRLLDTLQGLLGVEDNTRILVHALEVSLPREPADPVHRRRAQVTSREELYSQVEKGTRLDSTFVLLVLLSTVVAAIGLLEDNTAVVIGAMVIAPLLGPNLALALGAALGETHLIARSLLTNLTGMGLALSASVAIGLLWSGPFPSAELLARTDVGLDGIALALASGAAAVLSLTTGLSSVLVGVMVAVALLPPTATVGLMAARGEWLLAGGAGLLLVTNVVCVNLAAKVVLLARGVKPYAWSDAGRARQSMAGYLALWLISLIILIGVIVARRQLGAV